MTKRSQFSGAGGRGAGALSPAMLALGAAVLLLVGGCAFLPGRSGSGQTTVEVIAHAVSEGETLDSIADDYYGTPDGAGYLADVNDIERGFAVGPGDVIEVPVGPDDIERYRRRTEAKILYNRGTVMAEAGDYAKAQEDFSAALRLDPRFADAGYNLGVVLLGSGEPGRAAAILEQVLSVRPDDALAEFALGKAYYDAGLPQRALPHFERAATLDPGLEDAAFAKAVALLKLGRRAEGVFVLDLYLREFPDGVWALEAREELERLAREDAGEGVPGQTEGLAPDEAGEHTPEATGGQ